LDKQEKFPGKQKKESGETKLNVLFGDCFFSEKESGYILIQGPKRYAKSIIICTGS
jgi:hypothetical protein